MQTQEIMEFRVGGEVRPSPPTSVNVVGLLYIMFFSLNSNFSLYLLSNNLARICPDHLGTRQY
jgi:hypothetical protein